MHNKRPTIPFLVALCAALALCAGTALAKRGDSSAADPTFQPSEDQKAVHSLKRQIAAEELARALQLSDEQKLVITSLIKDVQAKKDSQKAARRTAAPQMRSLMEDYLDEVRSAGAASETTISDIRALQEAQRPEGNGEGGLRKEIKNTLRELLSDEQLKVLRDFRPMADVQPERRERHEDKQRARGGERKGNEDVRGEDEGARSERKERRSARRHKFAQRHRSKRTVKNILLSAEMLEVLGR